MSSPEGPVRLIPDGCDYLLRGVAPDGGDADTIPVRAIAPDGRTVIAHVQRDASGVIEMPDETNRTIRLINVYVPASQVFPAA